jgi:polar amino acid transport system permease protein
VDGRPGRRARAAIAAALPQPTARRLEREAARKRRTRRQTAISAVSTVAVLGGLAALILTSEGWPTVKDTFFNPSDFADSFPAVLKGFWLDVKLFCLIEVGVLILGLLIALARISRAPALFPLRLLSSVAVDVLRGIPVILVIYLIGFGVPALELTGVPDDPLVLGAIALGLTYSAYVGEVYRAGITSVHSSQRDAALAVGLSETQAMRRVILPQAIRRVAPPLLNDFVSLQKDVSLISILGPLEAFRVAQIEAASNFIYTPLMAAALLYLCVTVPLSRFLDRWERGRVR